MDAGAGHGRAAAPRRRRRPRRTPATRRTEPAHHDDQRPVAPGAARAPVDHAERQQRTDGQGGVEPPGEADRGQQHRDQQEAVQEVVDHRDGHRPAQRPVGEDDAQAPSYTSCAQPVGARGPTAAARHPERRDDAASREARSSPPRSHRTAGSPRSSSSPSRPGPAIQATFSTAVTSAFAAGSCALGHAVRRGRGERRVGRRRADRGDGRRPAPAPAPASRPAPRPTATALASAPQRPPTSPSPVGPASGRRARRRPRRTGRTARSRARPRPTPRSRTTSGPAPPPRRPGVSTSWAQVAEGVRDQQTAQASGTRARCGTGRVTCDVGARARGDRAGRCVEAVRRSREHLAQRARTR